LQSRSRNKVPTLSLELYRKAQILRAAPLFEDRGGAHHQKAILFLVLAGAKPVGEASSGHMVRVGDVGHSVADNPKLVEKFLSSLGLTCEVTKSVIAGATDAVVSLDPNLVAQYRQAANGDFATVGRLFGYPETAVTAFAAGPDRLLTAGEQDRYVAEAGINPDVVMFRLSREHWADELIVAARWQQLLEAAGLIGPAHRIAA
jgi:hypothetical protein